MSAPVRFRCVFRRAPRDRRAGPLADPSGGDIRRVRRRYRPGTLILETLFETDDGAVRVVDFMPVRVEAPDLVRIVEGVRGRVRVDVDLVIRFDYGSIVPWVRRVDGVLTAVAGPDALVLTTPVDLEGVTCGPSVRSSSVKATPCRSSSCGTRRQIRCLTPWTPRQPRAGPRRGGATGRSAARTGADGGTRSSGR